MSDTVDLDLADVRDMAVLMLILNAKDGSDYARVAKYVRAIVGLTDLENAIESARLADVFLSYRQSMLMALWIVAGTIAATLVTVNVTAAGWIGSLAGVLLVLMLWITMLLILRMMIIYGSI